MTVTETKSGNRLLAWALAVSLTVHLAAFGGWKWSQTHPWWRQWRVPSWLQVQRQKLVAAIAQKLPAQPPPPSQPPMLYIDVDPNLASAEPPKNPKFYSSDNTIAANVDNKTPSDTPQVNGTQTKVIKTVPNAPKMAPEAPKPPPEPAKNVALQPTPEKPPSPEEPKNISPPKPLPKPASAPGDLAYAKPAEKANENKETNNAADNGTAAKPEPQPAHQRPRTIAEALAQRGLPGPISRQEGGVPRLGLASTMDTARTPYGDYDADFIAAVRARWYELVENRAANTPGKVVLEFDLHADGRITGMTNVVNEVNYLLETFCESAVLDPAPYKPWTQEMRGLISEPRHLRFTFYYEND